MVPEESARACSKEVVVRTSRLVLVVVPLALFAACNPDTEGERYCFGDGVCVEPDGNIVDPNGNTVCSITGTCGDTGPGDAGGDSAATDEPPPAACNSCTPSANDLDGDCVANADEVAYFASNASCAALTLDPTTNSDVDGDGVDDGCENLNFDGARQQYEMNACATDTDGDGIDDGLEDRNRNGRVDPGESHPVRTDSDFDGIADGLEDRNQNGLVDPWVDVNGDGCYTAGTDTAGESNAASLDSDLDGLPDSLEDQDLDGLCDAGETCLWLADSDCDLLPDGKEDKNANGVINTGETDPLTPDTDGDGLRDGVEDANRNGAWDQATETSPLRVDSDGDGIRDGVEDRNLDGQVTAWHECGANTTEAACAVDAAYCVWTGACAALSAGGRPGVYDPGIDVPGESDPRRWDSDGDGIGDGNEDLDRDGVCNVVLVDFISTSGQTRLCPGGTDAECADPGTSCQAGVCKIAGFVETCAFVADTDGDGLADGLEDINRDGRLGIGETSPIRPDSDFDGLLDGCPAWAALAQCEDKNNNGRVDAGETDPLSRDTDGDLLADGCEVNFDPVNCVTVPCSTNPLDEDTDADGFSDGEEDGNHNCTFELGIGETDPRLFTAPPGEGTLERAEFEVCATRNLKPLSFAVSARETHDYRVAFEVELDEGGAQLPYLVHAYGADRNGNGFSADDPLDALWGHAFQSPEDVDDPVYGELNRDVYGFTLASTTGLPLGLDDILDGDVRAAIEAIRWPTELGALLQLADVTSRPAHDDIQHNDPGLTDFRVNRAQRIYQLTVPARRSALQVRNELLRALLLRLDPGATAADAWPANLPQQDPSYPNINCPASPQCYLTYTVQVGVVQRVDRGVRLDDHRLVLDATNGRPQLVFVVAVTQNDSTVGADQRARYEDRLARLEDLTGGSAVARYDADRGKICERRGTQQATADLLWVVDDSRSMQSMINRLLQAAQDARAVLLANREIVDFRVAMTTSNPAIGYRNQCPASCNAACTGNAECSYSCSSEALGCLKVCPAECTVSGCNGTTCTCGSCSGTAVCSGTCLDPAGLIARVLDESALSDTGADPRAWLDAVAAADVTRYPMPGGGGTFYFEDSAYLDCKSASGSSAVQNQDRFINTCAGKTGFADFFAPGDARLQLLANAGFLGADVDATCETAPMNLVYDVDAVGPAPVCQGSCPRLTEGCSDGPTVLVSQMCDLIRAMGGFPCTINPADVANGTTSSTRTHSALEMGTRTARRLIEKMLPAYPRDYGSEAERKVHLRLDCSVAGSGRACPTGLDLECDDHEVCTAGTCQPTGNCAVPCDPRAPVLGASGNSCTDDADCVRGEFCSAGQCYVDCRPVPLVSVFLSDEEDAYFKDECSIQPGLPPPLATWDNLARDKTDTAQLPELCYWTAGDPLATDATCQGLGETACQAEPSCAWNAGAATCRAAVVGVPCSESYCAAQGYATGWPAGFDPDLTNFSSGIYASTKWRDGTGAACSADPADLDVTCIGDPCKALITQGECEAAAMQPWCVWSNFQCVNRCGAYTFDTTNPSAGKFAQQKDACLADPICRWNQGEVRSSDQKNACQLKVQVNDCQACKRLRRTREAILGGDGLVGFGDVGPVYAIARNKGAQGEALYNYNQLAGQDECAGGFVTWGRGDGQSFRDLAIGTLGRTQNVCTQAADGYRPFMQLLITDIAALSAPYPLSNAPIAATIKVGIARPNGGGFDYIEVPRSRTSGFFYNGTTNSIGFKSDPVDGQCGGGACTLDGVIELSEINYAAQLPHVPKTQDLIFISYRYWLPVPCAERCGDGESCVRLFCPEQSTLADCDDDSDCTVLGERCLDEQCQVDCTPGESLEVCTCGNCPACHVCDTTTGECRLATNDPCICDPRHEACRQQSSEADCISLATQPSGQSYCIWDELTGECGLADRCEPGPVNTCGPGAVCDESCTCVRSADCPDGFFPDGTIRDCPAAEQCCRDWAAAAVICPAQGAGTCASAGRCYWDGAACLPTGAPCCAPETGCGVDGDCSLGQTCNTGLSPARCAPPLEDPVCRTDPETGLSRIVCESSPPCVCIGETCSSDAECNQRDLIGCRSLGEPSCLAAGTSACTWDGDSCEPTWQTCDLGTGRCTPACHPVREYCDDAFPPCGCQFVPP